jgi:hypothetical protein
MKTEASRVAAIAKLKIIDDMCGTIAAQSGAGACIGSLGAATSLEAVRYRHCFGLFAVLSRLELDGNNIRFGIVRSPYNTVVGLTKCVGFVLYVCCAHTL